MLSNFENESLGSLKEEDFLEASPVEDEWESRKIKRRRNKHYGRRAAIEELITAKQSDDI